MKGDPSEPCLLPDDFLDRETLHHNRGALVPILASHDHYVFCLRCGLPQAVHDLGCEHITKE